jgi:hypothetical protein
MDRHLAAQEENGHQLLTYSSRDICRIIEELGKQAGIQRSANPSIPGWTFAVNQWRGHAPHNTLQKSL